MRTFSFSLAGLTMAATIAATIITQPACGAAARASAANSSRTFEGLPRRLLRATAAETDTDWLRWGGPTYDFSAGQVPLATTWPAEGPRRLWHRPLGEGFSAILAGRETVYATFRRGGQEIVAALAATDGTTRWERGFDTQDHPEWRAPTGRPVAGAGPYATPLVSQDRVFFVTSLGVLHALDRETGKLLWTRNLWTDLQGNEVRPGYTPSPLAYKDRLVVPVGGPGRGLVCLRQRDGALVWSSVDAENGFASPILIDAGGPPQIVSLLKRAIVGVDAETGRLLWRHAHVTQHDVNASTPLWGPGNILFVSSAYDGGSRAIRLDRAGDATTATELWHTRQMRVHHTNAIRIGGYVYASNGDFGPAPVTAIDVQTGAIAWRDRRFAKSTLVAAGAHTLLLEESGKLALITLTPEGLTVHAEADVLAGTAWTVPTLVGARLYVRNQKDIAAFELPTSTRSTTR